MICCCERQWNEELTIDLVQQRVLDKRPAEQVVPVHGEDSLQELRRSPVIHGPEKAFSLVMDHTSLELDGDQCYVFTVGLHRAADTAFGLDLSAAGRICMVNAVVEGSLVADWNRMWLEKGAKEQTVQRYDRLVALNTERFSKGKQLMQKLRDCMGQVSIVVQRPVIRKIIIQRPRGKEIGITIVDGYSFLLVASIAEGVFRDHNLVANPDDVILLPSLIVSVNAKHGSGSQLLKFMHESQGYFEVEVLYYD